MAPASPVLAKFIPARPLLSINSNGYAQLSAIRV